MQVIKNDYFMGKKGHHEPIRMKGGPETVSLDTLSTSTKSTFRRPGPASSYEGLCNEERRPHWRADSAVLCEPTFVPYIQILPESDRQTDGWKERGRIVKNNGSFFWSVFYKNIRLKPNNMRPAEAG